MVDWEEYEEVKAGVKSETEIVAVDEGTQDTFRSDKYWEAISSKYNKKEIDEMKKRPAIEAVAVNGARMVINLPPGEKISPAMTLAIWKKTYGDYPKVGQKVTTKTDDNGFQRIVLEMER